MPRYGHRHGCHQGTVVARSDCGWLLVGSLLSNEILKNPSTGKVYSVSKLKIKHPPVVSGHRCRCGIKKRTPTVVVVVMGL
jgi:hypothetical protein